MTDTTNDHDDQNETPSGPDGQDTSEHMDRTTQQDPDTTEVLPAQSTPPTQQIAQHTQRLPGDPAPDGTAPETTAPEGEVHPAYGVAAARVQQEEQAAAAVHDAPVPYDADPLAPLREQTPTGPATPVVTGPASTAGADPTGPAQTEPTRTEPTQSEQSEQAQRTQQNERTQQTQLVPGAQQATEQPPARRGARVGTAVWGLIVLAIGLGVLAVAAGVVFDLGVALIVLLGAAGVILVVGSVISSLRRR